MIASNVPESFQSPSLSALRRSVGPAYELKFLVDESLAHRVEDCARTFLEPDPHGDPARGGAYHTTTLYLDTPELDVFHRSPSYRRRKFRVRRYGMMSWVFVERKTKGGDRVTKRRAQLPASDITRFGEQPSDDQWDGQWFHQRIAMKRLQPACRVSYDRTAWVGACDEGPMRLTVDRNVRGALCEQWRLSDASEGMLVLTGAAILELKFLRALPLPFKRIVEEFRLNPSLVSKYRLCRTALGVADASGEVARA